MLTNVTNTSIMAFHSPDVQASIQNQRLRVAAFIIMETKTGKPTCRTAIWEHFARAGDSALNQKGSVARAVNELVKLSDCDGVVFDGKVYEMRFVDARKYGSKVVEHFCMVLRQPREANQLELFS